jgi:uncharacterized protein YciI
VHFAVIYTPGSSWTDEAGKQQAIVQQHVAYQDEQYGKHIMLMGGPFIDRPGGMAVFNIETKIQLDAILAQDPSVVAGFYIVAIYPWYIAHTPTEEECGRLREGI